MSRGSVVIVVVLSLFGVLVMEYLEFVIYLVKDHEFFLGEAMSLAGQFMLDPQMYAEVGGELLQMLLFMALGIWIAWRYMSGQTNSSKVTDTEAQLASLRRNPTYAQGEETGSVY